NIAAAVEEQKQVRGVLDKAENCFVPIPAIPPSTNVSGQEFAAALRQTVDQMQRDAASASVVVPPNCSFSFTAGRPLVLFGQGSLQPLTGQLGEVKVICDVFNKAKVNALNAIRREKVSADDEKGPASDYTTLTSQTNDLAIITPYEVQFQCFSPDLAMVLSG